MARIAIGAEEKKKLYVLGGLLAAIMVVVFVLYRPTGNAPADTPAADPKATPVAGGRPVTPPTSGAPGTPAKTAVAATPEASTGTSGGISAASLVSVSNFRSDPFEPVPLPPPVPTPPPPPGPVNIEPPTVFIQSPGGSTYGGVPPFDFGNSRYFGGTPPSRIFEMIPPPRISRVADVQTAPTIVTPPGSGGDGSASRAPNKRLSGVIIGDSVRAILEISDGDEVVTRIVQPGDEVDGIRILRIERTTEGGRPVTRMYIRENGEEKFVDLRAAPQQTAGGAGAAGGGPGRGGRTPF